MNAFLNAVRMRLATVQRLFRFLWQMKMWWLMPLVIVLLFLSLITIMATATPLGPFIYALF